MVKKNFKILSHSFDGEYQVLKIKYKNSIKNINLNLIGKIQIKNILMAIIAAEKQTSYDEAVNVTILWGAAFVDIYRMLF